jgi:hypothetical protein
MIKRRVIPVLPLLLLLAFGCSGGKGTVATVVGKVTYSNQPVTGGQVIFYPAEGPPAQVGIGADGTYTITDIPTGDYAVTVETESVKQRAQPDYGGRGRAGGGGEPKGEGGQKPAAGGMSPKPADFQGGGGAYVKIPDKYSKKETSGLKTTVGKGKNTYDIPLTD